MTDLLHRAGAVEVVRAKDDEDAPKRLSIVAATDKPVRVWGADEVLSMKRGAVDLTRLRNSAPFLADHKNSIDSILGRIDSAKVEGGELRVEVELARTERADAFADLVEQGMAGKISVGYTIESMERTRESSDDEVAEYTATRWTPHEVSMVAVPADDAAAVQRIRKRFTSENKEAAMPAEQPAEATAPPQPSIDREAVVREERERAEAIRAFGTNYERLGGVDLAEEAVKGGASLDEFKATISERVHADYAERQKTAKDVDPSLGLSERERKSFSFVRAIRDMKLAKQDRNYNSHELDVLSSANVKSRDSKPTHGDFTIPDEVLESRSGVKVEMPVPRDRVRTLFAGSGGGDNLVAEVHRADAFIDFLRARSAFVPLCTNWTGLVGDQDVPRQTSGSTAHWRTEGAAASALSDLGFDSIKLTPKELIAGVGFSRKFAAQATPDGEMLIRRDLAQQLALALDLAVPFGTGANGQPDGVYGRSHATQRVGPAGKHAVNLASVDALQTRLDENNALYGMPAFVTNPTVAGRLRTTLKSAGVGGYLLENGMMLGYPVSTTTQIPNTFTDAGTAAVGGARSAILFGNWEEVVIGQWSGIEVIVDPYTQKMKAEIEVAMHLMYDLNIRHNESVVYDSNIEL